MKIAWIVRLAMIAVIVAGFASYMRMHKQLLEVTGEDRETEIILHPLTQEERVAFADKVGEANHGEKNCEAAGGKWGMWSRVSVVEKRPFCNYPMPDAYKPCNDGSECLSRSCEIIEGKAGCSPESGSGSGTHEYVVKGKSQGAIIFD